MTPWDALDRVRFVDTDGELVTLSGFALAMVRLWAPTLKPAHQEHARYYVPDVFDPEIDPETHPERWRK